MVRLRPINSQCWNRSRNSAIGQPLPKVPQTKMTSEYSLGSMDSQGAPSENGGAVATSNGISASESHWVSKSWQSKSPAVAPMLSKLNQPAISTFMMPSPQNTERP